MATPTYHVPALEKGLDLIELLASSSEPLTLTSLARTLGRSNNEIFRILNCLESRGYVRRESAGGYRLSLRLLTLTARLDPVMELIRAAAPEMRALGEEVGESTHLAVLEGSELVVIHRNESPRPVRLAVEVGGRFPAIHTVSGRLLLSFLSPQERTELLSGDARWQSLSESQRKEFERTIRSIQQKAISTAVSETVQGVADVAVGCGFPGTPIFAALAISSLSPVRAKVDPAKYAPHLLACAERIRHRLGGCSSR